MTLMISSPTSSETRLNYRAVRQFVRERPYSGSTSTTYTAKVKLGPSVVSKEKLFDYLSESVFEIADRVDQSEAKIGSTVRTALALANFLLEDGSATPQATPDGDGGINVEWLVNGNSLVVSCVSDAEVHVWAENSSGHEVVSVETNSQWSTTDAGLVRAKEFLAEISGQVVHRISAAR